MADPAFPVHEGGWHLTDTCHKTVRNTIVKIAYNVHSHTHSLSLSVSLTHTHTHTHTHSHRMHLVKWLIQHTLPKIAMSISCKDDTRQQPTYAGGS